MFADWYDSLHSRNWKANLGTFSKNLYNIINIKLNTALHTSEIKTVVLIIIYCYNNAAPGQSDSSSKICTTIALATEL